MSLLKTFPFNESRKKSVISNTEFINLESIVSKFLEELLCGRDSIVHFEYHY
jgi:hypothetical protein